MTVTEARRIERTFYRISNPSEDDVFIFTEAMEYLIAETHDARYMLDLGGYYYGEKNFRLALKYYEMAEAAGGMDESTALCLGYIWYYGRVGEPDYEKAYRYYSLAKQKGSLVAAYKLADMVKNGYYVPQDWDKYKKMIEELYPKVKKTARFTDDPLPEVATRLAGIRAKEGKTREAIALYQEARTFLEQRIRYNPFFGNRNIMMWLIDDLYSLQVFDEENFSLYDLFWLLKSPCRVTFNVDGETYEVRAEETEDGFAISFNGEWFRNREDFFARACIGASRLTALYDELADFEVTEWKL